MINLPMPGADAVSAAGVHDIWRYAVPRHSESVRPLRFRALPFGAGRSDRCVRRSAIDRDWFRHAMSPADDCEADGTLNAMMLWQIRPQKTLKIRLTRTNLRIS
jgi:hypothetical protein